MRNRKKDEKRIIYSIVRILLSMGMISISIFIVFSVIHHIINYPFLSQFAIKEEAPRINITVDNSLDSNSMFISDEKGLRFRKSDNSFARDEWIDKNGELFYFDLSSYGKEGSMRYEGQVYYFENGKLKKITRDEVESSLEDEYYNGIDSLQYFVYLDKNDEAKNHNYPIKYIKYADDETDYLGTKNDKQYCKPNFLKINMSYIYYLSTNLGNENSGRLFRMVPNAEIRESAGSQVVGYIVLSDDVVYYYNGSIIVKVKNWQREKVAYLDDDSVFQDALNSVPIDDELAESKIITPGNGINVFKDDVIVDEPVSNSNNIPKVVDEAVVPIIEPTKETFSDNIGPISKKESELPELVVPNIFVR